MAARGRPTRRRPGRRRSGPGSAWHLLALFAVILTLLMFVNSRLYPVVENMAAYQVRVYATRTINNALMDELEKMDLAYGDVVMVTQNKEGGVTSVQADMMNINRIKARMTRSVAQSLEETGSQSIFMPVGTLIGNEWLSGRGPLVEIKMLPVGYVQTEIYNQFTSAGINQTLHQVMLRVNVQMTAIIPGYNITTDTTTNFSIAETVIVGSIPEAFTQIEGDGAPLISKINDYAAE